MSPRPQTFERRYDLCIFDPMEVRAEVGREIDTVRACYEIGEWEMCFAFVAECCPKAIRARRANDSGTERNASVVEENVSSSLHQHRRMWKFRDEEVEEFFQDELAAVCVGAG